MEVEAATRHEAKLQMVLESLLSPSFELRNDVYLNKLLSHIEGKDNPAFGQALQNLPLFSKWLSNAVRFWEENKCTPSSTVTSFTLQLTSFLSRNEANFIAFTSENLHVRLCAALKLRNPQTSPLVKVSYVRMLTSLLQHKSGIDWIMATDNWQDVLHFYLAGQTVFVQREGKEFIYQLLIKGIDYNEVFCSMVVQRIMSAFTDKSLEGKEVDREVLEKKLVPTLILIDEILEYRTNENEFLKGDLRISNLFKSLHLEQYLWKFFSMAQTEELSLRTSWLIVFCYFNVLVVDPKTRLLKNDDVMGGFEKVIQMYNYDIGKGYVDSMFRRLHWSLCRWSKIKDYLPTGDSLPKEISEFPVQILIMQLIPIMSISIRHCEMTPAKSEEDSLRELFTFHVCKHLAQSTIRMAYSWKEELSKKPYIFEVGCKAIMYTMKCRKHYSRDMGIVCCQVFIYSLKDIVEIMTRKPSAVETFRKETNFFKMLFHALVTFVDEYEITWRESVETVCLLKLAIEFLRVTAWYPTVIVQALKLVNISIAKFLAPNLALLVDSAPDSATTDIAPLLTTKLHDLHWEVRDSALEVLQTISEIALSKFPGFQPMVLEAQFPSVLVSMAMCDTESYVRASAIKCLSAMIRVPEFWNGVLDKEDLPNKMMHVLLNETEAIVRREASSLMCSIYEYQKFPPDVIPQVHKVMSYAATSDLHWEVKVNSLDFWKSVGKGRLIHQGMIDGKFPTVTFSKEHRKIVTLTPTEIRSRIGKVLVELSRCGCLGVFMAAIEDDDLEVVKKAVTFLKTCSKLLREYSVKDVIEQSTPNSSPASPSTEPFPFAVPQSPQCPVVSNAIIDGIVDSKDASLLAGVYRPNENGTFASVDDTRLRIVPAQQYVNFVLQDLDSFVEEKKRWLQQADTLGSLLDDILRCYNEDVNVMDCY